jgi:hypothetical protein
MENVKANAEVQKGFNMTLPDAYLKEDKSLNKMSYYDKADSDSAKAKKLMKSDPYYNNREDFDGDREEANSIDTSFFQYRYKIKNSGLKTSPYSSSLYNDPNEAKVYEKLDQLNKVLNNPPISEVKPGDQSSYNHRETASVKSEDVDRLEQMMQTMNESHVNDPEMQQLIGYWKKYSIFNILTGYLKRPNKHLKNGKARYFRLQRKIQATLFLYWIMIC